MGFLASSGGSFGMIVLPTATCRPLSLPTERSDPTQASEIQPSLATCSKHRAEYNAGDADTIILMEFSIQWSTYFKESHNNCYT